MDLEEELGAPLFERRARGVRLTAAGELFVRYIREQSGDVERMRSQIEDLKGLRRGPVRLACGRALARDCMRGVGAADRAKLPPGEFEVKGLDLERARAAPAAY